MINSFSFCIPTKVFILHFVLKEIFAKCRVVDCQIFFPRSSDKDVIALFYSICCF